MKHQSMLYIGGPADGKVIATKWPNTRIRVDSYGLELRYVEYRVEYFRGNKKTFSVMVDQALTPDDVFELLLNNYKP